MPTSRRQQLVDAVIARFQGINGTGDYNFDLSSKVFEWRHLINDPFSTLEVPAINVLDRSETTEQHIANVHLHTLTIEVLGAVASGANTGADMRKLIADLTEAIQVDRRWGQIAYDTDPVSSEVALEQEGAKVAHIKYTFRIRYRTKSFDPYDTQ